MQTTSVRGSLVHRSCPDNAGISYWSKWFQARNRRKNPTTVACIELLGKWGPSWVVCQESASPFLQTCFSVSLLSWSALYLFLCLFVILIGSLPFPCLFVILIGSLPFPCLFVILIGYWPFFCLFAILIGYLPFSLSLCYSDWLFTLFSVFLLSSLAIYLFVLSFLC